ncbi:MAG: cupin domain-containing protein [Sulfurimonas sp.]|nr:cupin domain-containing protein [Sulfurimonas sp.]
MPVLTEKSNILELIPKDLNKEVFETIISKNDIKIERIISYGQATTEFKWYSQESDEWVILLKGEAILSFLDEEDIRLKAGDYINIQAFKKHKVSWTLPNQESIWLAVHY